MYKNFALAAILGLFGTAAFAEGDHAKKDEATASAEATKEEKKPEEEKK